MTWWQIMDVTTGNAVGDYDDKAAALAAIEEMRANDPTSLKGLHLVEYDDEGGPISGEEVAS